jgi:polyisoprenoid-binding protein YceI
MKTIATLLLAWACTAAYPATYGLDPMHTNIMFEIDHILSTNRGKFDRKEGVVQFDPQARTGSVTLTIDTASINTGIAPFNRSLQSNDFFRVEQFPTATFVGDNFVFSGDKVTEVNGHLTMVGKTNPVRLKALRFNCIVNAMLQREVCGGDFEATINRSEWGMVWGLPRFPDAVRLVLQVEAIRQ